MTRSACERQRHDVLPEGVDMSGKKMKVLITKIGLDGHDRGAKVVAMILKNAGVEVVYLGRHQTAESIIRSAIQEDVDVIGISSHCEEHLTLVPEVVQLLKSAEVDIPVVVGGIIRRHEAELLKQWGVSEVFFPGSDSKEIVKRIRSLGKRESTAKHTALINKKEGELGEGDA